MATTAKTVLPIPYPSALYMAGAKSGKPNPATERKQDTAASATYNIINRMRGNNIQWRNIPDAACKVNASIT